MTSQSAAWIHFEKIPNSNDVLCKLCKKTCKRKDLSTKGLWSHLQHMHKLEHDSLKGIAEDTQQKVSVYFFKNNFLSITENGFFCTQKT